MSRPESNRSLAQRPNTLMWDFGQVDLLLDQGEDLSEDTDERPSLVHQREFHDYFYQLQFLATPSVEERPECDQHRSREQHDRDETLAGASQIHNVAKSNGQGAPDRYEKLPLRSATGGNFYGSIRKSANAVRKNNVERVSFNRQNSSVNIEAIRNTTTTYQHFRQTFCERIRKCCNIL